MSDAEWGATRPIVCRTLGLPPDPQPILESLAVELDKTYREVARRLPDNQDVRFEKVKGKEELILTPLDALDEPPSLIQLRKVVAERLPRIDPQADYGELNVVSRHRLKLQRIAPHWDDMLGLGGSLLQGRVPATGIMRTLQVGENPTRLAQGIAEFGRIDKTLHSLRFIDDKDMRRGTLTQLNRGEAPLPRFSVHLLLRPLIRKRNGNPFSTICWKKSIRAMFVERSPTRKFEKILLDCSAFGNERCFLGRRFMFSGRYTYGSANHFTILC